VLLQNPQNPQNPEKRSIHFGVRGDLAVDYGGGYGKAIQSKSCFSSNYSDVDEHIKRAALQLTGERVQAETPTAFDRRVVDISIKNAAKYVARHKRVFCPLRGGCLHPSS
jgi:hypothetical protein